MQSIKRSVKLDLIQFNDSNTLINKYTKEKQTMLSFQYLKDGNEIIIVLYMIKIIVPFLQKCIHTV